MKTSPGGINAAIRRLIERHQVERVEIVTRDGKAFTAIAYPAPWHPIIGRRRDALFIAVGRTDLTLSEVTEITDKAQGLPICRTTESTIEDAVAALTRAIREGAIT